jgi:hypothetical protein
MTIMRGQLSLNRTTRDGQQLILVMLLILAAAGVTAAQSNHRDSSGTKLGQSRRPPDLVIDHFELTRPSRGEVKIQVTNMGGGDAGTSTLRLIVWKAGKLAQKEAATIFAKVPALAAGKTTWIVVMAGIPIRRAKHSLSIDISEDAK